MGRTPRSLKKSHISSKDAEIISKSITKATTVHLGAEDETTEDSKRQQHVTFDDMNDEIVETSQADEETVVASIGYVEEDEDDEDEMPEIVSSKDVSVQELKDLFEKMNKASSLKRKKKSLKSIGNKNRDLSVDSTLLSKPFDVSLLSDSKSNEDIVIESKNSKKSIASFEPEIKNTSSKDRKEIKKIGHMEVVPLEDNFNYFSEFKISNKTHQFLRSLGNQHKRVSFMSLASMKKPKPSSVFVKVKK